MNKFCITFIGRYGPHSNECRILSFQSMGTDDIRRFGRNTWVVHHKTEGEEFHDVIIKNINIAEMIPQLKDKDNYCVSVPQCFLDKYVYKEVTGIVIKCVKVHVDEKRLIKDWINAGCPRWFGFDKEEI